MFWFWFFVGPALLLSLLALRGERRRAAFVARAMQQAADYTPPASVIVPVKGDDEGLAENLAALAALDYPDYELLVCARSALDIPPGVLPPRCKIALSQADDPDTSEKIQNLLAAVRYARRKSQILAFADSDGSPEPGWLRALAAPLQDPAVGASTGYRWYVPEPPDFWSLLRSVWNGIIAGTLGPGNAPFVWGGSMAIRRETFSQLKIAQQWEGAISDDYTLYRAVRSAGLRVAFCPGATIASPGRIGFRGLLEWTRRQMIITRFQRPRLWWPALLAHIFYCGGMAASVIASIQGHRGAEWALLAQLGPGMLKAANRATLARAELPRSDAWFRRHGWVHTLWAPLATWLFLYALLASAFTSVIEWRSNRYDLSRMR